MKTLTLISGITLLITIIIESILSLYLIKNEYITLLHDASGLFVLIGFMGLVIKDIRKEN